MKQWKAAGTKYAALLLGALAILAWMSTVFLAQRAEALSAGVLARWSGAESGVSPAQLERAKRYAREDGAEHPPVLTLWREHGAESLSTEEGRGGSAAVLELLGDGADLWPVGFVAGYYPAEGDETGCAVDQTVAEALWGSGQAVGQTLRWKGQTYTVRGVMEGKGGVMLVQSGKNLGEPFQNLLLRFSDGDAKAQAESWLSRNQFYGAQILDLPMLSWGLGVLAALPGAVLAGWMLLRLLRRGLRLTSTPLLGAAYALPALGCAALVLWCAGFPPQIPDALIPTRWSDFDFWARMVSGRVSSLTAYLAQAPTQRDLRCWPLVLGCLVAALVAAALTVLSAERAKAPDRRRLMAGWGVCLGVTFLGALAFAPAGGVALGKQTWLLPVLWLAVDWALARHENGLKGGERLEET